MKFLRRFLIFPLLFLPIMLQAQKKPWPIKVVIVTTFEEGADTGDDAGELQYWVEREHLDETLPFPGGVHPLRANGKHDVLAILTGMTLANAGPSIMALGLDPRFDLSHAYFLVAGVAGVDPRVASIGSAAWASFVVNDVSREIDSRETPHAWPYGFFVIGATRPGVMPKTPMTNNLYTLNAQLAHWAFSITKNIQIPDNHEMQLDRQAWASYPNAARPPFVLEGDSYASDTYWHGTTLTKYAEDWVNLWTTGRGRFAMANMEDSAIAEAFQRLSRMNRVDYQRLMVLRTASNFSMQKPGSTALESVTAPYINSTAYESAWLVGSTVVHELTGNWNLYRLHLPRNKQ
ncbi:purine-nucleoside phosphorylase [Granulicella arctica]|uniref:Purine nucleoside permease n=1 Tax=Granulicella arctica TaxID=940613 RepID=A0A7Y9TM77_9BACT|nr:purine nucleoside permease [Granulicella arctica]NYF80862.1 purine nucleoside permease [Granulicella arctica]